MGPGSLWRDLGSRIELYSCRNIMVTLSSVQYGESLPTSVLWSGECHNVARTRFLEGRSFEDIAYLPGSDEWILVTPISNNLSTEVIRARFPFIYSALSNLDLSSRVRFLQSGCCFLCAIRRPLTFEPQEIVIYSFLDEAMPATVRIIFQELPPKNASHVSTPAESSLPPLEDALPSRKRRKARRSK